jgi:hypothetical protein
MSERDWECDDPFRMMNCLESRGSSPRKLRLLAVACCRQYPDLRNTDAKRRYLDCVERSPEKPRGYDPNSRADLSIVDHLGVDDAVTALRGLLEGLDGPSGCQTMMRRLPPLFRDVFGNPYHQPPTSPVVA